MSKLWRRHSIPFSSLPSSIMSTFEDDHHDEDLSSAGTGGLAVAIIASRFPPIVPPSYALLI
jgi:hypothetical protein